MRSMRSLIQHNCTIVHFFTDALDEVLVGLARLHVVRKGRRRTEHHDVVPFVRPATRIVTRLRDLNRDSDT